MRWNDLLTIMSGRDVVDEDDGDDKDDVVDCIDKDTD